MFTATKLRRGMIPKDKEGECWTLSHGGRAMCHHSLFLTTILVTPLLVGGSDRLTEDRHAHTLSTTCLGVVDGLSTMGIESLFVSLMLGGVKRFHIPLLGVLLPSLTPIAILWVFFPVHAERWFSSASRICLPADRFFPRFTQSLVSSSTIVRLRKVQSFHRGIVVGISFTVMCFGGVFFPSRTYWELVSFPIVVWVISLVIALNIGCCGFIVVVGYCLPQLIDGLCFSL